MKANFRSWYVSAMVFAGMHWYFPHRWYGYFLGWTSILFFGRAGETVAETAWVIGKKRCNERALKKQAKLLNDLKTLVGEMEAGIEKMRQNPGNHPDLPECEKGLTLAKLDLAAREEGEVNIYAENAFWDWVKTKR